MPPERGLHDRGVCAVETALLHGPLLETVPELVRTSGPELLVLGGSRVAGKDSFRGHADALARAVSVPVMVVRPESSAFRQALELAEPLRIFVAVDSADAADAAIVWLEKVRARIACEIVVGHYFWPPDEYTRTGLDAAGQPFIPTSQLIETLEREAHERFSGLAATCDVTIYCEPRIGSVAINLLSTARACNAHVAVVGPHHRRGLDPSEHGVVSRDVLDHCDMPVVCVGNE